MKKRKVILLIAVAVFVVLLAWAIWENTALQSNTITVQSENLPESFDGFRIAHVSDLHNAEMGQGNEKLLLILRQEKPDIIAITGDLVDSRDTDLSVAITFCKAAVQIAPSYYVTGNHEVRLDQQLYEQLLQSLRDAGVTILNDEQRIISRGDDSISIVGHFWGDTADVGNISRFDGYKVLLSHHPEAFADYVSGDYDLVLSGHAHGGQFRLPIIGGLYAPGQGFFPKYDSGLYSSEDTSMIVSRGIGNSLFPLRFNNPPEVIIVILKA